MARARDYAAEYARRIANAQRKAAESGQVFDRSKARGHRDRITEGYERRARRLARKFAILPSELQPAVKEHGWEAVADRLEAKDRSIAAYLRGESEAGHADWESADRGDWADVFYWYHSTIAGA